MFNPIVCVCMSVSVGNGVKNQVDPITVVLSQQTRYINPMLAQCWPTVYDAGPTLDQHWVDVSCLLGYATLGR